MTVMTAVLLYLLLFRLSIVGAGIVSLMLGYRLFFKNRTRQTSSGSTIDTLAPGIRIAIRNAAPGTGFALFGALLIIVMLVESSPSVTMESISKAQSKLSGESANENSLNEKWTMRGGEGNARTNGEQDTIESLTLLGRELEQEKNLAGAEEAYTKAVTTMAEPMNDLAWLYLQSNRVREAQGLAALAVQLRPDESRYLDTLNKVRSSTALGHGSVH